MSTSTQTLTDVKDEARRLTFERLAEELAKQGKEMNQREAEARAKVEASDAKAKSAPTSKDKET